MATTSNGRTVVFASTEPGRPGLWKTTDGGRPVQLTPTLGVWPTVTRDDRSVVFATSAGGGPQSLWIVSIDGGMPAQVAIRYAAVPLLSPDGRTVGFQSQDDQSRPAFAICNLPDCSSLRFLPLNPNGQRIKWTPDGSGFLYVNVADTPQNLWIEPLDGTPPRQLTHFTDDRQIADAAWSRDGKRLAIARTTTTRDIVLFKGLKH
jgi:Tol biopolymer transport system component